MTIAWYWPPSGSTARGVACVPSGARLVVPDWTTPRVFPFTPGIGFGAPVSGASGTPGFSAAAIDGSGGVWFCPYNGANGLFSGLSSGLVYTGIAYIHPNAYVMASNGSVWGQTGAGPPPSFAALASWPAASIAMTSSGSTLISLLPGSGLVGLMTTGGVSGSIALPGGITTPSCLAAASGLPLAVGGWINAPPLSGAAAAGIDPQNFATMMAVGSGRAMLWQTSGALSENWSLTQTLSGLANLAAMSWRPDGTQVLAASPASGMVQAIGYSAGIMSLVQGISISGACSVAVAGGSINALVAQSGLSQLATLTYSGAWVSGTPVTGVPGIAVVVPFGPTGAVASTSGGVAFLSLITGTWNVSSNVLLGFAPTALTVDPFLQVYAGGSGAMSVLSGSTVLGSGSWSGGAPTAIAVQDGRVVLAVPSDNLLRLFGQSSPGVWTQQSTRTLSLGTQVGLALSDTVLFTMGSGATNLYGFSGTPYVLTPVTQGAIGLWSGSTWTTTNIGVGNNPADVAFDASGNVWAVTVQGTYWSFASSGTILSSGIVPVFTGQFQTTPLGYSAICPASGAVYVATSLAGVLIQVE
jgi:hypothetical protein